MWSHQWLSGLFLKIKPEEEQEDRGEQCKLEEWGLKKDVEKRTQVLISHSDKLTGESKQDEKFTRERDEMIEGAWGERKRDMRWCE